MTVKEYNKEFLPKIQRAQEFIRLFESAIQHMNVDKHEVMRHFELHCWSEETKQTILTALNYYKKHEGLNKLDNTHGHWFLLDECSNAGVYCSECHKKVYKEHYANVNPKSKFCPNCGAFMDGEFVRL